jgi:heptaprenyl diphosphate synthase
MKEDILGLHSCQTERRWVMLGFFTAFSIMVYLLESFIPKPLPFLKLGLANIMVLMLLTSGYPWYALVVALSKTLLGGLLSGTFLSPATALSLAGTIFAFIAMLVANRRFFHFSIIGISICGAVAHNLGQIVMARMIVIRQDSIFYLTPMMVFMGIATGMLIGYIAKLFLQSLQKKVLNENTGLDPLL